MLLPRLDRFAALYISSPIQRYSTKFHLPAIPILMYHNISDAPESSGLCYYRVAITPRRFRQQMRWLHFHRYTVLDLATAVRLLESSKSMDVDRCIVLTFDDGCRDFLTSAWPALAEFGFTATMFLPTGFISYHRKSFDGRDCLTWPEIREMQCQGVSFGSHTVNHRKLYELPWPEIRRELRDSRLQIEDMLQAPIHGFSYPYAFPQEDRKFVQRLKKELLDHGYRLCVTTAIGRAYPGSDALALRRLPINECDDEPLFRAKLSGAYDCIGGAQAFLRYTTHIFSRRRSSY